MPTLTDSSLPELRWIEEPEDQKLARPSDDFGAIEEKTFKGTFLKKARENMLVPLGLVATTTCLTLGLLNMRKGNHVKQQLYMRGRVGFQAFTLAAMTIGVYAASGPRRE